MNSAGDDGSQSGRRAGIGLATAVGLIAVVMSLSGEAAYPWIKAAHVVAVMSWMAGLLYLPRLFVYHSEVAVGSSQSDLFKVMERRLLWIIMTPAMVFAWVLGLWLGWRGSFIFDRWFILKFLLVVGLSATHGYFASAVRQFAADAPRRAARHWRLMNEVPTVLMIAIVILVVVKPF